jgi:hypothetical protein
MEKTPRRKSGSLFFWLMFVLIVASILSTVLLANNRRNLDLLIAASGLVPERRMVIPQPGRVQSFKGKRLKGVSVMLPDHLFTPSPPEWYGGFARQNTVGGKALCDMLRQAGLAMTPWQPGGYSKALFECSVERTIANPVRPDEPSTFFLIVKGAAEGAFQSLRIKLVFADDTQKAALTGMAAIALRQLALATGWNEISAAVAKVRATQPFVSNAYGIETRFFSEFGANNRFNLLIRSANQKPPERRTLAFFDRDNFLPLVTP